MQTGSSLRLHRRSLYLDGASWTVLTPRPGDTPRYATGVTDESVHVLTTAAGMEFLGHALWALAFQHHTRTLLLFDLPQMVPNATTGESSRPVVWVNADLGVPGPGTLDALRVLLPISSPSEGTLKLRTAGLDRAVADPGAFAANAAAEPDATVWNCDEWDAWVTRQAGLVTALMNPAVLRAYAVASAQFGESSADDVLVFDRSLVDRAAQLPTDEPGS